MAIPLVRRPDRDYAIRCPRRDVPPERHVAVADRIVVRPELHLAHPKPARVDLDVGVRGDRHRARADRLPREAVDESLEVRGGASGPSLSFKPPLKSAAGDLASLIEAVSPTQPPPDQALAPPVPQRLDETGQFGG